MKKLFSFLFLAFCATVSFAQVAADKKKTPDPAKTLYTLEASCGTCQFKMKAKGCPLAVKFEGKPYLVEGTNIDDHGDAHAEDGFCKAVRKAKVQGEVVGDKFVVSFFELIKE